MKPKDAGRALGQLLTAIMAATALAVVGAVAPVCAQGEPTMLDETAEAPYALAATLHVAEPDALRFQVQASQSKLLGIRRSEHRLEDTPCRCWIIRELGSACTQ